MSKVPDLFKGQHNLAALRPAAIQQHVQQQQQQQRHSQPNEPQLLQRLYACLDDAAVQGALSQQQHSVISDSKHLARRQLDAYHRVFELLLASLTTYRCVHNTHCRALMLCADPAAHLPFLGCWVGAQATCID